MSSHSCPQPRQACRRDMSCAPNYAFLRKLFESHRLIALFARNFAVLSALSSVAFTLGHLSSRNAFTADKRTTTRCFAATSLLSIHPIRQTRTDDFFRDILNRDGVTVHIVFAQLRLHKNRNQSQRFIRGVLLCCCVRVDRVSHVFSNRCSLLLFAKSTSQFNM
jgi:hypothetical protein